MRVLVLVMSLLVSAGCTARKVEAPLPNGYSVLAMGSTEMYIADPQRELLFGPTLVSVGIVDEFVVAFSGWESTERNGFYNTVGYNILDTKSAQVVKKLTQEEARNWFSAKGLEMPALQSPSELLQEAQ
jgi:hypothetical protein